MKKIIIVSMLSLFSTASFAGETAVYSTVAPTLAEAQLVVDDINAGRIRVGNCVRSGRTRVYDVELPNPLTTTRINRFGQIEVVPAKTKFKVDCGVNTSR